MTYCRPIPAAPPLVKKIGTNNSYVDRYDESGRMFPGLKKKGTKYFYVNRNDGPGRMLTGVKKIQ